MAKGGYIGDGNNKARKLKKAYIGDENNKARKVKKGYIGDENGKAKLFWTSNINTLVTWDMTSYDVAYSVNLQTWINRNIDIIIFSSGTFGNDKFVRFVGGKASYSTDGINWTTADTNILIQNGTYEFLDGKFVCYDSTSSGNNIYHTSTDGFNWNEETCVFNSDFPLGLTTTRIIKVNNKYIMIGNNFKDSYSQGVIFISEDVANWTGVNYLGARYCTDIAYGNGKLVVVGNTDASGMGCVRVSSDFFDTYSIYLNPNRVYNAISFGNGVFVALSDYGISYSTDGIDWIAVVALFGITLNNIVFTGERFFCSGSNGYSYYSIDGVTWTQMSGLSNTSNYRELIYSIDGGGTQPLIS